MNAKDPPADARSPTITVTEISITGLAKIKQTIFKRSPDIFVVVKVHDVMTCTVGIRSTENPRWSDKLHFPAPSPGVIANVEVFSQSKHSAPEFVGSFSGALKDFQGSINELKKGGNVVGRLVIKADYDGTAVAVSTGDKDPESLERGLKASKALETPGSLSAHISRTSGLVDAASSSIPVLQGAYGNVQALAAFVSPIGQALKSLDQIVKIVDGIAEVHPICKVAWSILSSVYTALRNQTEQDDTVRDLGVALRDMLAFANEACDLERISGGLDVIKEMGLSVQEGAKLIEDYMASPFFLRAAKSAISPAMSKRIQTCQKRFSYLNEQFDRIIGVQTWKMSKSKDKQELLDRLPSVHTFKASYDRVPQCLPGTRTEVLDEVLRVLRNTESDQPHIIWIYGLAGSGKSTITSTIAQSLADSQNLGGCFFFSRKGSAEQSNPDLLFASIARELAIQIPRLSDRILNVIKWDAEIVHSAFTTQFTKLIVEPLQRSEDLRLPTVVILDGLDECTAPADILSVIANQMARLPMLFKFLVTSRPEPDLREIFEDMGPLVYQISLNQNLYTDRDITLLVNQTMPKLARRYSLAKDWPGRDDSVALVKKAGGLFIWIITALNFIGDKEIDDPEEQLKIVLGPNFGRTSASVPLAHLDALYSQVLKQGWSQKVADRKLQLFQKVIGSIMVLGYPLNGPALGSLIDEDADSGMQAVAQIARKLQAVLIVPKDASNPIQIIHPSFVDFLTNADRCLDARFLIQAPTHHRFLACRSFHIIHKLLKRNICHIEAGLLNSEIRDLEERIGSKIRQVLQYACRSWAGHLAAIAPDFEVVQLVTRFFFEDLLSWLEVSSLLGQIRGAIEALDIAYNWLLDHQIPDDALLAMANDSQRFVKTFREPISQSALHVYASAIPFTPGDTLLYSTYGNKHDIRVLEGIRSQWTACLHVLEPTDYRGAGVMQNYEGLDPVHTATISTDGRRILSQSNTGILRLWDAATGFLMEEASEISISRSFKPSSPSHPTALFSPNGKRIISFCYVLRLWNGLDLRAIGGPFRGHKGITTAATYSADGSCIASGSADTTVRLWNGNDGSACGNTLRGHSGSINTVAFSPDGETLVSASADCTIRLWSISRGRPIGEPLTGHSGKGTRALISPNGLRIISTSGDGAVRFWDMTGNLIAQRNADTIPPPPGRVLPMAFSSEGSRVVVGLDRELQVLDTMVGALIGNPIKGHTAPVKILAFSRDGRYIVSSTGSSTIRVWESTTGAPVGVDLRGHIDSVTSVEFAPNGRHIISASDDETVRLWDVTLVDPAVEPKFVGRPMNISVKPEPRDDSLITISADGKCLAYYWSGRLHLAMGGRHVERRVNLHKQLTLSPNGQFLVATEEPRYEEGGCATYLYTLKDKPAGDFLNARVEVPTDSKNILSISFSSDGKRMLVVLPSSLETWGGGLESIEYTLLGKVVAQTETYVLASISPDGRRVVSTSSTRTIQLWDSTTFTPIGQSLLGHGDDIQSIRFSEDGSLIVSQSESQMLCWEVNSQLPVKIPSSSINVGFSKLDWRTGWVETLDGRKLWWMPASNRGWASVMSPQAHLATIGATGELTLVDGTRLGQQAKRGWAN